LWGYLLLCLGLVGLGMLPLESAQAQETTGQTIPPLPSQIFLPYVHHQSMELIPQSACPQQSERVYELVEVDGPSADRTDSRHADLNLSMRSYQSTGARLSLVEINGPTDGDAPQLAGTFLDGRMPLFSSAYQVYDWDWGCGPDGCRGSLINNPEVTLLGMAATPGEAVAPPRRGPEIMQGGFIVLVLYAEEERITLGYTRHDTVAPGYAVHMEQICVDPNLLALYTAANEAGRGHLPGLKVDQVLGSVPGEELLVAIRDRGSFMDPRSRKDWWR
jgi:hypothetical protein